MSTTSLLLEKLKPISPSLGDYLIKGVFITFLSRIFIESKSKQVTPVGSYMQEIFLTVLNLYFLVIAELLRFFFITIFVSFFLFFILRFFWQRFIT